MGFIIATFVSGLILGSLIPGYLTRKEKEKFESEFVVELHEQLEERSKIMCQNCYFKKRIEKLEEE